MDKNVSNQKNLPPVESSAVLDYLLVMLTFLLYGFYWLDKQSSKLRQNFGVIPFNEGFIKYGYISFALMFVLPAWLESMQITNTTIWYIAATFPAPIVLFLYLYCSMRYASTISKILGHKKTDLLVLLGTFIFHVAFLNWWQNQNAGKKSKLSVNSS